MATILFSTDLKQWDWAMPNRHELKMNNLGWISILLGMLLVGTSQADVLDTMVQTEDGSNQKTRGSQQRVNTLSDETEDLLAEFKRVVRETESLRVYNAQLEKVVGNQVAEISSINRQLDELEATNRGVVPMLIEMIDMLEQIVNNDTPFMLEARQNIVLDLQDIIYRADVTTSEKYRRVMEAYQREIDYGRNAAAYEGKLPGTERTVTFLMVGRALLIYQTLDFKEVGWWNPNSRAWEALDREYLSAITRAIRIAKNQEAPNLVRLPVPGAGAAQ
jgi:regulator of replication initiation timing